MGFDGQVSQAMARAFERGGHVLACAGDFNPDGPLLRGVEQEARVFKGTRALFPGSADKGVPVLNVGGGPGGEALGAAGAVESRCNCPGGTVAGGDQQSAVAQPRVDCRCG